MKTMFKNYKFKKALALLLTVASLLLVSCSSDERASSVVSDSSEEISSGNNSEAASENSSSSDSSSENSENASSEDDYSQGVTTEDASSEDASSEDASSEDASSEDASSEDASSEDASSEDDSSNDNTASAGVGDKNAATANLSSIPEYSGDNYVVINKNQPYFSAKELSTTGFEIYGDLDSLGRCTYAIASCGPDTLPTEDRGSISSVKPTGWVQAQYSCIKTSDLYNRSHLIAWSLTGENANKQNLVTGTAHLNQTVMTEFEDMILDYIKETGNHVAYRVTPLFSGNELVCRGIQMEAYSVEDNGDGICFNIFAYNVQPGVIIDYATGKSQSESGEEDNSSADDTVEADYILNTSSKKIHLPECSSVTKMAEKNKQAYTGTIEDLEADGYTRCGSCLS